jgi:hypothetical protein
MLCDGVNRNRVAAIDAARLTLLGAAIPIKRASLVFAIASA